MRLTKTVPLAAGILAMWLAALCATGDVGFTYALTAVAGPAGNHGNSDGTSGASQFGLPESIVGDSAGNIHRPDSNNHTVHPATPGVAPSITSQPHSLTVTNGDPASFSVTAGGTAPLFYQWQKNGANLVDGGNVSGSASNTLSLSAASTNDVGNYTVIITNTDGSVTSSVARLIFLFPNLLQNSGFETGDFTNWTVGGNSPTSGVSTAGMYIPACFGENVIVHSGTYAAYAAVDTEGTHLSLSQPVPVVPGEMYDIGFWMGFGGYHTGDGGSSIFVNGVWQYSVTGPSGVGAYEFWDFMWTAPATTTTATVQFNLSASGTCSVGLSLDDFLFAPTASPPSIISPPQSLTVAGGNPASFSVTADGTPPLFYQWQKNGTNLVNGGSLSGVNSNVLSISATNTNDAGGYTVTITNIYAGITSSNVTLAVPPPPVAGFSGSPATGAAPLTVTFTDTSTGNITNWFWNFGGGNTTNFAAATNLVYTYNIAGTYTVSLTVSGLGGSGSKTNSNYIVVTNPPPPVADFSGSPTSGLAPLAVTFTDSSPGNITNWFWNFGDSTTNFTVATNPVHTYDAAGTNTVSLTVSGLGGSDSMTKSNYIVALCPPQLVVSPASRDYGSVTVGQTNSLNFSVINTGCMSLTGTAAVATGPFAVSTGSPYDVSPGQTGTVTVAFAPSSAGDFTNDVIFASNGGVSTNQVTGIGLTPGNVVVAPATNDFGTIATGDTAQTSFTVTNTGGTAVTNGTAAIVTGGSPFSVVSNATFSVAGFGSTNVVVEFAPVSVGNFTNDVAFDTANGGTSTNQVTANAMTTGDISVTPTDYDFTAMTIGMTNQTTFVVTNTGSTAVTNGTAAMVTGGSPFSILSGSPFSIPGFGSTNVVVQFAPVADGVFTNNVAFDTANGGVSTNQVTGIGLTPGSITVTPASYGFGILATGTTAQTTFMVTNTGGTTVTNGTASMVTSNSPFSVVSNATFSVAGFGSTNVMVQFAPVTSGAFTNNVAFNTANGGVSTNMVTGAGTPDVTPPTLIILNPTDYEVFNTNRFITVSGTANDASGIAGVTVNGATATLSGTNWSRGFTLLSGTNTITVIATDNSANRNVATQIVHAVLSGTFSNRAPVIVTPPVVTNALLQVDGLAVVAAGETNTFSVGAVDPDGDSLSYQWMFGDGVVVTNALSNTAEHVYTTNCGPYTAGVSVSDGDLAVSSNLTVVIACDLAIKKMQVKLNFAKANLDSASLSVTNLDLGAGFGVTNKVVRVDIGGTTNVVFTLNAKGKGVSSLGSCKLTYNKKAGTWGLTAKLAKGSWHTAWASCGLVNADVPKTPPTTVTMPVVVMIGADAFAAEHTMFYTAKAGKSGKAK